MRVLWPHPQPSCGFHNILRDVLDSCRGAHRTVTVGRHTPCSLTCSCSSAHGASRNGGTQGVCRPTARPQEIGKKNRENWGASYRERGSTNECAARKHDFGPIPEPPFKHHSAATAGVPPASPQPPPPPAAPQPPPPPPAKPLAGRMGADPPTTPPPPPHRVTTPLRHVWPPASPPRPSPPPVAPVPPPPSSKGRPAVPRRP